MLIYVYCYQLSLPYCHLIGCHSLGYQNALGPAPTAVVGIIVVYHMSRHIICVSHVLFQFPFS